MWCSNTVPLKLFVPDFVSTLMAAPPAMPVSASMLLVTTLTASMVSSGGL